MRVFLLGIFFFLSIFVEVEGQNIFGKQRTFPTNVSSILYISVADLDNDMDLDILSVASKDTTEIAWYKNDGIGNFGAPIVIFQDTASISYSSITYSYVSASDLNDDNFVDILASDLGNIFLYFNDGQANFNAPITINSDLKNQGKLLTSDMDNDGDIDIVSYSSDTDNDYVIWYENDGTGNFSNYNIISNEISGMLSIITVDFDMDSDNDVLIGLWEESTILWYENDGMGNFSESKTITNQATKILAISATDLDTDGDLDILFAGNIRELSWFENKGDLTFSSKKQIHYEENSYLPYNVEAKDIDKDGDIDCFSGQGLGESIVWFENNGVGEFSEKKAIEGEAYDTHSTFDLHLEDLDGDDYLDVVVAKYLKGIGWYKNLLGSQPIKGFMFYDFNENGLYDENEMHLLNQQILLNPTAQSTFTNFEEVTHFFVENGEYQLSTEPITLWELTTPEIYNITVTDNSEHPIYYFGFKPTRILPRVVPHLGSSPTRCNTKTNYWLNYSNTGTTIAKGTVTLEVDELMDFIEATPEPDIIENGKLTWYFSDLLPSHQNKIQLNFQMPNQEFIGEMLETQATVQLFNENEELVYNKTITYDSEVRCSYDPNDKLTRSNLLGQSEFAYIEDTIHYTIRFQNTGNDTAFNIRIEDVLDKKLDWTTFHPITSSHDYRTSFNRETGLVNFHFDDILLPDSTTNQEGSNGFVTFGIASLPNIGDKTEVGNTAYIFFDFNPPIITNTAILTLLQQVETDIEVLDTRYDIAVYPNPFSDFTTIEINGLPNGNYELELTDIFGRTVRELKMEDGQLILERGELEDGLYLFRIVKEGNEFVGSGKVLVN